MADVNKNRAEIKEFKSLFRAKCHESILECYHAYNRKGGTIVPMQTGGSLYFSRAVILAIYADQPAATKCTLTGSACPACYTSRSRMAEPSPPSVKMRTDENMHDRREWLLEYKDRRNVVGASERAKKFGRKQGVQLGSLSPWSNREHRLACANDWVFGPDPVLDNVYQCMPQVIPDQYVLWKPLPAVVHVSMLHVLPVEVSFTLLMSLYTNIFVTIMSICLTFIKV